MCLRRKILVITPYIWVSVIEGCCIYDSSLVLQQISCVSEKENIGHNTIYLGKCDRGMLYL